MIIINNLNGGLMIGNAKDNGVDALVEHRHGGRALDEVGEGLNQLLGQTRLLKTAHMTRTQQTCI